MKIAIPYDDGKIGGHFGHCKNFLFIEVEGASNQIIGREELPRPESDEGCGFLPKWLAEKNVNTVIALGMGEGMRRNLGKAGISVVFCKSPQSAQSPETLAIDYAKGHFSSDPSANTCDHGPDHACHTNGHNHSHHQKHRLE